MAELIQERRSEELDSPHLSEYLTDMARRDRCEVESRLALLIAHLLKWGDQAEKRSRGWRLGIVVQRQELVRLLGRGVLRNHVEAVLAEADAEGVEQAVAETGLPAETFPADCLYTLDQLISAALLQEKPRVLGRPANQ